MYFTGFHVLSVKSFFVEFRPSTIIRTSKRMITCIFRCPNLWVKYGKLHEDQNKKNQFITNLYYENNKRKMADFHRDILSNM